jgi:hypothetical protein
MNKKKKKRGTTLCKRMRRSGVPSDVVHSNGGAHQGYIASDHKAQSKSTPSSSFAQWSDVTERSGCTANTTKPGRENDNESEKKKKEMFRSAVKYQEQQDDCGGALHFNHCNDTINIDVEVKMHTLNLDS